MTVATAPTLDPIETKFARLAIDYAPGQEVRQSGGNASDDFRGDPLPEPAVDGGIVRAPDGGGYVFPRLPDLSISLHAFV